MSDADAPNSSDVEKLKKFLTKYGTELLKPYDFTEELIRRLDKLEHLLSNTPQDYKKLVEPFLEPSKEALITKDLIRHSELDVRVSVASCISQIIRITAPDEPYEDDHMKEFFQLANIAFERFPCMYGRVYSKALSILHAVSHSESCVMMLDLGLYADVDHMFHLFLDGIRTKHPFEVFTSMETIMTTIIHSNVDYDEFSLVLVKILLNNLKRESKNVAPVSFKLAENTLKNCSADLKTYIPEAVRCLDVPIEDYAEVVVSLFHDASQGQIMDPKNTVENVSSPGEAGLAVEADLCNLMEGNETQNSKNDENHDENQGMISQCFDDPDKLGKAINMQQEQKQEELHTGRKRNRRPSSLQKAEEGYDPFWMLIDWRSMKSLSKKSKKTNGPAKTKISKDFSPKSERNEEVPANKALEPTSEETIVASEDETRDSIVKSHFEKGQGSLTKVTYVKKSRRKTIVSSNKALEPTSEGKIVVSEDGTGDFIFKSRSEKEQGSLTKVSSVKKSRRKATVSTNKALEPTSEGKIVVSEDETGDFIFKSRSEKGHGSLTKVSSVKKSKRKAIVSANKALEPTSEGKIVTSEDETGDFIFKSHSENGQGSLTKVSSVKKSRRKAIVSANKALEPTSEGKIVTSEDETGYFIFKSHSENGQGSLTKVSSVKKSRRKAIVSANKALEPTSEGKIVTSEDETGDFIFKSRSENGQGSLTKVSSVKKSRRALEPTSEGKIVSSEDETGDFIFKRRSEEGQGSVTNVSSVKKSRRKTIVSANEASEPTSEGKIVVSDSEDETGDFIFKRRSEKGQRSLTKVSSVKKSRRKAIVSANTALEPTSEGKIVVSEDETGDFIFKSRSEKGQGSSTKVSSVKKSRRKAIVSANKAFEPTSEGKIVVSEDETGDFVFKSRSVEGEGSLTKVCPVKISRRKAISSANKAVEPTSEGKHVVSEDETGDITVKSRSVKGEGSLTKVSPVKISRRKAISSANKAVEPTSEGKNVVSEDETGDITVKSHSEKGQGSLTKVSPVKKSRRKTIFSANKALEPASEGKIVVSEDEAGDIIVKSHSEKGRGSVTKLSSVKKSMRKTIVSEDLKEDIVTLASQCRPISSQAKAQSVEVSKQKPKGSVLRPRKRLRTASGSVGEEVVGCRIKVWWPLDKKFYKGKIVAYDPLYKAHQVDYDDGEIEILDLTGECWELLQDSNSSADHSEIDAAPSSSKAK